MGVIGTYGQEELPLLLELAGFDAAFALRQLDFLATR